MAMQSFNLRCCRFLPFIFLLIQCIQTDPGGYDDNDDTQSVVSPLLDGSNNLIITSENALKVGDGGQLRPTDGLFDINAAPPLRIASDQTDDACPLPPMKEYSQRRKVRRGDACTAPLQIKPGARTETKPKTGNNDGASKTPGNQISPHNSAPLFEPAPSSKAPKMIPIISEACLDPLINNPVCALRIPDLTNWVERQYQGISVELPECYPYTVPCTDNLEPWCCAIVSPNLIKSEDGTVALSGTLHGYTCVKMNPFLPIRLNLPSPRHAY